MRRIGPIRPIRPIRPVVPTGPIGPILIKLIRPIRPIGSIGPIAHIDPIRPIRQADRAFRACQADWAYWADQSDQADRPNWPMCLIGPIRPSGRSDLGPSGLLVLWGQLGPSRGPSGLIGPIKLNRQTNWADPADWAYRLNQAYSAYQIDWPDRT